MGNNHTSEVANVSLDLVKEELLSAINKGDVEAVKSLLDTSKPNDASSGTSNVLRYTFDKCETLVDTAIELKQGEILELLVEYFDHVCKVQDSRSYETPLMIAARNNQEELVELLLNHGANVNAVIVETVSYDFNCVEKKAESALIFAVEGQNENIVKILLNHGANVLNDNDYSVHRTWKVIFCDLIDKGRRSMMDLLMNFWPESKLVTEYVLFLAVEIKKLNLIEELLERGVDIETENCRGYTPLMIANSVDVAEILLKHGANVNSLAGDGSNSLQFAVKNHNFDLVRFLLNNGANVNVKTKRRKSPLEAAIYGQREIFAFLLECGAKMDMDNDGFLLNFDVQIHELNGRQVTFLTEIAQPLVMYVVKWQAENNFATRLDSQAICNNFLLNYHYKNCKKEMGRAKDKGFSSSTFSLYDILKSNTLNQLTSFARIREIGDYLKTEEFKADFPIYADLIVKQFEKGVDRKVLLQRVCNFFRTLSIKSGLPNLTILSTNTIFSYLHSDDLINLRRAYYS